MGRVAPDGGATVIATAGFARWPSQSTSVMPRVVTSRQKPSTTVQPEEGGTEPLHTGATGGGPAGAGELVADPREGEPDEQPPARLPAAARTRMRTRAETGLMHVLA